MKGTSPRDRPLSGKAPLGRDKRLGAEAPPSKRILDIPDVPPSLMHWPCPMNLDSLVVLCTIPGEPLSKQRPRFGKGRTYDPVENSRAQATIVQFIRYTHKSISPDAENQFGVRLAFFMKSGQRRDLDNMCKLVMDACTGVVWKDDLQVTEIFARQSKFEDNPRTELAISKLGPLQKLTANCEHCGKEYNTYKSWKKGGRAFCGRKCQIASQYPPVFVKCRACGNELKREKGYISKNKTGTFWCSRECRDKTQLVELKCAECGKSFKRAQSLLRGPGLNRFCSVECKIIFARKRRAKNAYGTCRVCGGETTKREYKKCFRCFRKKAAHSN